VFVTLVIFVSLAIANGEKKNCSKNKLLCCVSVEEKYRFDAKTSGWV
jgi:hypothetical protein